MAFFEHYYSHIYLLFHEGFTNVEYNLAQKGNTAECSGCYLFNKLINAI